MPSSLLTVKEKRSGGAASSELFITLKLRWSDLKAVGWLGIGIVYKTTPVLAFLCALPEALWARDYGFP